MGIGMFIVGASIFSVYIYFIIMNAVWDSKKQKEENNLNIKDQSNSIDYDGMGDFSRFPSTKETLTHKKREKITLN
jgi:hypothetical protein